MSAITELRANLRRLVGAAIGLGCGIGCYTPVSSLFFRALEHQFGWSKSAAVVSFVALPLSALIFPLIGWILDHGSVRRVALICGLLMAACLFGLSRMNGALPVFYALFLAMNLVGAGAGPISYTRIIVADFTAARGLALAIALVGMGGIAIVLPPLLAHVIAADGWRAGYQVLGAIVLGGSAIAFLLLRGGAARLIDHTAEPGVDVAIALRSRPFWALGGAIVLTSAASYGFVSQLQSIGVERGLSLSNATLLVSLLAAAVVLSRLAVGRALDIADPRWIAAATLWVAASGVGLLLLGSGAAVTVLGVGMLGVSIGAELDLMSFFCARCFGMRRYSSIYGLLAAFFYLGIAIGGVAYGAIHDRLGSYQPALSLSAIGFLIAGGLMLVLPRQPLIDPGRI